MQVKTVLLCKSFMLRVALEHMLAGSAFDVQNEADDEGDRDRRSQRSGDHLFILDIAQPLDEILAEITSLKSQHPGSRVVVVSDSFDDGILARLCADGADGFCLTSSNESVLVKALELVMLGEVSFPSASVRNVLDKNANAVASSPPNQLGGQGLVASGALKEQLSSREIEILRFLMNGTKNRDIAISLNLSEATIKVYIQGILKKIGAQNRTQAAMWATSALLPKA